MSNSCFSFSSKRFNLADVTRASANGPAFLPRTGDDTCEDEGDANGEAAGDGSVEATSDSVELAFDRVPPFSRLNAL